MKLKIKGLGVQLFYPLGGGLGLFQVQHQYFVEAEDGRIDTIEELDEAEIPDGTYTFSKEAIDNIFDRPVELAEDEW